MSDTPPPHPEMYPANAGRPDPLCGGYFVSLTLTNVRCFRGPQTIRFADERDQPARWTILLGNNGTGKSTVLQSLAVAAPRAIVPHGNSALFGPQVFGAVPPPVSLWKPFRLPTENADFELSFVNTSSLLSPSSEPIKTVSFSMSPSGGGSWTSDYWHEVPSCIGYGATRRLSTPSVSEPEEDSINSSLFADDARLRNPEEWLLRLDYSASKQSDIQVEQEQRLRAVKSLLERLLPDVSEIRISTPDSNNRFPRAEFLTPFGWIPLRHLGHGYRTLVAWIVDLASRLVERFPNSTNPLQEPNVVLVDELDLHLHPIWQRNLMSHLSERLPNTQFIVAAHSPLVVQAAPDARVVLLKRVEDCIIVDNDSSSIRNWRIDQLLTSDLFGLPSARPPAIASLIGQRRSILQKKSLSEQDEADLKLIESKLSSLPTGESAKEADDLAVLASEARKLLRKEINKNDPDHPSA